MAELKHGCVDLMPSSDCRGASAGGVEAVTELLAALPSTLAAAICVVIHIPAHTPSSLHRILARTPMPVGPAEDGEALRAERVYVGVADRHLMLSEGAIRLTRGPKECRRDLHRLWRDVGPWFWQPRSKNVAPRHKRDDV
jgi:hypothetical protein